MTQTTYIDVPILALIGAKAVSLSPLPTGTGKLTMEAWINPTWGSAEQVFLCLGDDSEIPIHFALTASGSTSTGGGTVHFAFCQGGTTSDGARVGSTNQPASIKLASAAYPAPAGEFVHVALTLALGQATRDKGSFVITFPITVALYLNGILASSRTLDVNGTGQLMPLVRLLSSAMIPNVFAGGGPTLLSQFTGQLAEVRMWNTCRSADQISSYFQTRAIGNEAGLIACYRLDQSSSGLAYDVSPQHGFAQLPASCSIATASRLPIPNTADTVGTHLNVKGKLVTEYLHYQTAPSFTVGIPGVGTKTLNPGETSGNVTVFDATLEPVAADGSSLAGQTIQVCPDGNVTVYLDQSSNISLRDTWNAGSTNHVTVPIYGKVRLRFRANGLTFPTLRVRHAGMVPGVWTLVRPDTEALTKLFHTTAAELLSPSSGVASPLPSGTSAADATTCADTLAALGDAFRPNPRSPLGSKLRFSFSKPFKTAVHWVESTANQAGKTLTKLGSEAGVFAGALVDDGTADLTKATIAAKGVGTLICSSQSEINNLITATKGAYARVGQAEITKAIASADRMAVISSAVAGQVVHKLAIIGSSIINGVTHVWQVVACGIQDALLAMNSFFARIGASIQKMVEFLAWMFNWNDFLRASDGIYHSITGALDRVPTLMQSLSQYKGQILDSLTLPTDLPKQSLAQMCGLSIPANMGAKEMDYVMELGHKLMSAADIELDGLTSFADKLQMPTIDTAKLDSLVRAAGDVASPVMRSATGLLTTPVSELVGGMNSATGEILDFVFTSVTTISDVFVKAINTLLTGRIKVPHLSGWIESTILGGRPLNLLRIVSLAGGIFEVLLTKIAASATAGEAKPQAVSFADSGSSSEIKTSLLISNFVISFLGSLVQLLRLFKEEAWAKKPVADNQADPNALMKFGFDGLTGVLLMVRSSISMSANTQLPEKVRAAMDAQAACEGIAGGAMIVWGAGKCTLSNGKNAFWLKGTKILDMLVQSAFGVGALGAAIAGGSYKSQFPNQLAYSSYGMQVSSYVMVQFVLLMGAAADLFAGPSSSTVRKGAFMLQLAALTCDLGAAVTGYASNQVASS